MVGSLPLMVGLILLGVGKWIAGWTACGLMGATLPLMLYSGNKLDKERQIAAERASELAPELWRHGEDIAESVGVET